SGIAHDVLLEWHELGAPPLVGLRMLAAERLRHRPKVRFRLRHGRSGRDAGHGRQAVLVARLFAGEAPGNEELPVRARDGEAGRHDADDPERPALECERAPHDSRIGAETLLPEAM